MKDDYLKDYASACDIDDLFLLASDRLSISAFSIMFTLKGPKRGAMILRILKRVDPPRHKHYWDRNNRLFIRCLLYVIYKLKALLYKYNDTTLDEKFYDEITVFTCTNYYNTLEMSDFDKDMFKNTAMEEINYYKDNPPKDQNEYLSRILESHGKKPTRKEFADFVTESIILDPLTIIDPLDLVEHYTKLMSC